MDSEETQLKVGVVTEYDGEGMEAAKEGMGEAGEAAKETTVELEGMAAAQAAVSEEASTMGYHTLREAAHAIHGVETAAEGGHMSILRWIMSLRGLYELLILNPFVRMATAIGVVTIAIGTWIKKSAEAREAIHEDLKKLEEENAATQKKIADDAAQAHFDGLKAELDEIIERFDRLNAAEEKKLALDRAMGDAALGVKLAELDTAEQSALKGAKGDPVKEAQVRESYAKQRLGAKHQNENANAEAAYNAAAREKQRRFDEQNQLEAIQARLEEKTPAREEYERGLQQTGEAAKKVGLQSKEEKQLEELEKLRKHKAELDSQGLGMGQNDTLKLLDLSSKEEELRKKAQETPEFEDREKETAREREAELPAWEENLKKQKDFVAANPSLANTEDYKTNLEGIEDQLAKAQAAKQFRAAQAQLKDQKDRAEKSEADTAKLLEKNKADLAKIADAQAAADEKEQLAGVKWKETMAKQKAESGKTLDAAAKDVTEKKFEQEQKARQAEINNAEEAAKAAKGKSGEEEAWLKLGELRKAEIGRRADGAEPTKAEALLEKSERGKIDEGTREKLASIREARAREAAQESKAAEQEAARQRKTETPEQLIQEEERARVSMSTIAHSIHGQGSARESLSVVNLKRESDSLAAWLKDHPNDSNAQNQLSADINEMAKFAHQMVTVLETSGVKSLQSEMATLKSAQRRMEEWIRNNRTRH
jgi:hypothetical protein